MSNEVALEQRSTGLEDFRRVDTWDVSDDGLRDTIADLFESVDVTLDARVLVNGTLHAYRNPAMRAGETLMHPLPRGAGFIELAHVPACSFVRGCDTSDWKDERPEGRVDVEGYFIAKYPTTLAQFRAFVGATGHVTTAEAQKSARTWRNPGFQQGDDHPLVCVSWHDSAAFCEWAGLRLPSEAEWECAARGTDGRTYPWGEDAPDDSRLWWSGTTQRRGTCPVGQHPAGASPFCVHDLAGNVWEWCSNWYDDRGYVAKGKRQESYRALRSGCWSDSFAVIVRAAFRFGVVPASWDDDCGFRASRGAKQYSP